MDMLEKKLEGGWGGGRSASPPRRSDRIETNEKKTYRDLGKMMIHGYVEMKAKMSDLAAR